MSKYDSDPNMPRLTALIVKQNKLLADTWRQLLNDDVIWQHLSRLAKIRAPQYGSEGPLRPNIALLLERERGHTTSALVDLVNTRVPAFAMGPDRVEIQLTALADYLAGLGEPIVLRSADRLLPNNPIEIDAEGRLLHASEAESKHLLQIHQYFKGSQPPGQPGRRPNPPAVKIPKPVDKERTHKARRAFTLKQQGKSISEIVTALGFKWNRYDSKAADRVRKKVDRLIDDAQIHPTHHNSFNWPDE